MRICLDIDGVLCDSAPVECQVIEELTGLRVSKYNITNWEYLEVLAKEQNFNFIDAWKMTWDRWPEIHPTEEHVGGKVGELMLLGQVDIVTATEYAKESVKKWLSNYHIPISNLIFLPYHGKKLEMDYDVWIDDSPRHAEAAVKQNKNLLLYTQPWNI